MLILTRKPAQGIFIGGNIYVKVLEMQRDRVKIGIEAPKEINIVREELLKHEDEEDEGEKEEEIKEG